MESVFHSYGINWIWYLDCTINEEEKVVTIHHHHRRHKYDDPIHPATIGSYSLVLNKDQIVTGVYLKRGDANLIYGVTNSKNVNDYA